MLLLKYIYVCVCIIFCPDKLIPEFVITCYSQKVYNCHFYQMKLNKLNMERL